MNVPTKLAAYAMAAVLAFGAAAAVGAAVGPIDVGNDTPPHEVSPREQGEH